ncbi:TetR/AcrR family transcriptional regulator [Phenylobacterium montanum]|uniref:TetR/AcrR family transcriptional regulator n=1 Tax=Phenylobacterium montanum TaxID=2823693 RepID=A0A975FZ57_9CAUL|nr:TetR/AcrR family transcriptional regulator [Caulobacter sp. S6]QUD88115.1 TetR/AcrR family transcriptional regulator [Caulobacter sp. S6]
MTDRAPSRQEPRRLKTRAALMAAGAELMAQRPIDAIPVNDIVDAAGVAKGSFFNHFADKDDFAAAVAGEIRAAMEAQVTAANRGVEDPGLRVARGLASFVAFALADPRAARIMLRSHDRALGAGHPLNAGVRADLELGQRRGRFRAAGVEAGVLYVVGVGQGLLAAVMAGPMTPPAARALSAEVLALLLAGLGMPAGEADVVAGEAAQLIGEA